MRAVIQRVSKAKVSVNPDYHAEIENGLLIFLGIEHKDSFIDIEWLVKKISQIRILSDEKQKMNLSLLDTGQDAMVISQFTLHASTKKGNRPSFIKAAKPEYAEELYDKFIHHLSVVLNKKIKTGRFGADMKVELLNDGPVTIVIDSKDKF